MIVIIKLKSERLGIKPKRRIHRQIKL